MIIKFLGTASGMPELNKRHSCLYVKKDGISCLIDCGEGASQAFLEEAIDIEELDFVFISHYHPDHISGLFMLLQLFYIKQRRKNLRIFLPEQIEQFRKTMDLFYMYRERFYKEIELLTCESISEYYPWITTFKTDHLLGYKSIIGEDELRDKLSSYGVNICDNDKIVAYPSDIKSVDSIVKNIEDADVLIIEGIHPPAHEFLQLEAIVKDCIYLIHGITEELDILVKDRKKFRTVRERDIIEI